MLHCRLETLVLRARALLMGTLLLFALLVAAEAQAHTVGVSRGEYRRAPAGLEVSLVFAERELAEFGGSSRVLERIDARTSAPCPGELEKTAVLERDGIELRALFRCPSPGPIRVSLAPLFRELARGHRHAATALPSGASTLLFEGQPELVVEPGEPPPRSESPDETRAASLFGFVRLGIEHILTGFDHLVFLLGLVVVGLGTKRTLLVASAFTLAHSISLVACTLGAWTPPGSIVEPAIALSIAYVGIENLVARNHDRRGWLAFGFGLIHGFGFASVLTETEFRGGELVLALAGFNAGVELGQFLVLALLLPAVALAKTRPTLERYGVRAVSAGVAAMGAGWFVVRVTSLS